MANAIAADRDVISRSTSTKPPGSYMVKIESFSLLAKNDVDPFTSVDFEAGGHKWNLILHPNGNKSIDVDDHISVYLKLHLSEESVPVPVPAVDEVHAIFHFFLFDHNNDNYLVVQGRARRFHLLKNEWGIDHLISLKDFKNTSNGYISNDSCVFGAEVYVCYQDNQKVDCISMEITPISYTHTWKIDNFSELAGTYIESTIFNVGEQQWMIRMYPKGNGDGTGTHISLFLYLADLTSLRPGDQIHAEFIIRILDKESHNSKHKSTKGWFNESDNNWGWPNFIAISDMNSPNKGYIKNNTCIIEAEVTVHGVSKAF